MQVNVKLILLNAYQAHTQHYQSVFKVKIPRDENLTQSLVYIPWHNLGHYLIFIILISRRFYASVVNCYNIACYRFVGSWGRREIDMERDVDI